MYRKIYKKNGLLTIFSLTLLLTFMLVSNAGAVTEMTFASGSIILPADSCWQPNNDPAVYTGTELNIKCDGDKNDRSLFQLYGLLYALLDAGDGDTKNCKNSDGTVAQQAMFNFPNGCKQFPIYWIIDKTKSSPQDYDLYIPPTGNTPLVSVFNSDTANGGITEAGDATHGVYYRGGPFIIRAQDLTAQELQAIKDKIQDTAHGFPAVKIHIFAPNDPAATFTTDKIDKVLIGKPPKVAVLNEGASDVLENYIRASGLFGWKGSVFQYVTAQDVLDGCLGDPVPSSCGVTNSSFQLLWAPHWIIGKNWTTAASPTTAQQTSVIEKVRDFLERGNSGFFECASIESWEGSASVISKGERNVNPDRGGFLVGESQVAPRIDTNGGCSDTGGCANDFIVYEEAPFWLMQCGGWNYNATGGHVHNMRPTMTSNYKWLTTKTTDDPADTYDNRYMGPKTNNGRLLTRFIHDDPTKINGSYTVDANDYYVYDYLVGGRINGAATQGYTIYFPGHKYVACSNSTTYNAPPLRTVYLQADGNLTGKKVDVEVVHANCTAGIDCPKVSYDIDLDYGERKEDGWVDVSTETAFYDPATFTVGGIAIISTFNEDTATSLQINDLNICIEDAADTDPACNPVCSTDNIYSDDFNGTIIDPKWRVFDMKTTPVNYSASGGNLIIETIPTTPEAISPASTNDSAALLYQTISGDFDLKLGIDSVTSSGLGKAFAGLSIRESISDMAPHVSLLLDEGSNLWAIFRDAPGAPNQLISQFPVSAPVVVRIKKKGTSFSLFYSEDGGTTWTPVPGTPVNVVFSTSPIASITTTGDLPGDTVKAIFTNFESCTRLINVVDLSENRSICSPETSDFTVQCSLYNPFSAISLHFSDDLMNDPTSSIIQVEIKNGPVATYDYLTGIGTSATANGIRLDMTEAVYDPTTFTLRNVKLYNTDSTCNDISIEDFLVTFPSNSGATLLNLIYNDSTNETICTPGVTSIASCTGSASGGGTTGGTEESIQATLEFDNDIKKNMTFIDLELTYRCGTGCSGTLTAHYDVASQSGTISEDVNFKIDMSLATIDKKKLKNIVLTNKDNSKQLVITDVVINFDKIKIKKFSDDTNKNNICDFGKKGTSPPATCNPNYIVEDNSGGGGGGGGVVPTGIYTLGSGVCDYYLSPYLSSCGIDWNKSNTCGIKYVLNTLLALKFQVQSNEFTKTQPIVKDNILYKASYEWPIYRGHLKKISVPTNTQAQAQVIWDAATLVPDAGTTGNPGAPSSTNLTRYIFTYLQNSTTGSWEKVNFDSSQANTLMGHLGFADPTEAQVLINTVRGRKGASTTDPDGVGEISKKLWAIEHSTPALLSHSNLIEPKGVCRDQVIFVGADDGMLHAFHAGKGTWDSVQNKCTYDNGTGKEIWAYIPSSLLGSLQDQPYEAKPDPTNPLDYSVFEPKISVDSSPALGDFLVNTGTTTSPTYEWKTLLVASAEIRNVSNDDYNKGVLFAMDVTDPYNVDNALLWEGKYYDTDSTKKCLGSEKNCNMGKSRGVAIGSTFFGNELKPVIYLVARWAKKQKQSINKNSENYSDTYCHDPIKIGVCSDSSYTNKVDCENAGGTWTPTPDPNPDCSWGFGVYAIDLMTGNVIWDVKVPYMTNISDVPPVPALMDIDDNGTSDYVVFGDLEGRLWAFNTVTGESKAGYDSNNDPKPVFFVPDNISCDADGNNCTVPDLSVPAGSKEPIGAPVSVKGDLVAFGTGASESGFASTDINYHMFVVRVLSQPIKKNGVTIYSEIQSIFGTDIGEQIFAKPLITGDLKVFVASVKNYSDTVHSEAVKGRIGIIDLASKNITLLKSSSGQTEFEGGVVGGFDADRKHAYMVTLQHGANSEGILQIGAEDFTATENTNNPFDVLWWRKL